MIKRILRLVGYGLIVFLLFVVVGLEGWYWTLLPTQLPEASAESIPTFVRDGLWLECGGNRKHDLHPLFPFILGSFLPWNRADATLLSQIARIHIGTLLQEGKLPHETTLTFHLREAAISTWISRHWTSDQTVDTYGSLVWMGHDCRGLQAGARHLFGEKLESLSLPQVALLMAIIRSPSYYDPLSYPERGIDARNRFLQKMNKASLIDEGELEQAIATPLGVSGAVTLQKQ